LLRGPAARPAALQRSLASGATWMLTGFGEVGMCGSFIFVSPSNFGAKTSRGPADLLPLIGTSVRAEPH